MNLTLRPAGPRSGATNNWTVVGGPNVWSVLADDSDETYAESLGSEVNVVFDASRFSSFRSATLRLRLARPDADTLGQISLFHSSGNGTMVLTSQAVTTTITEFSYVCSNLPTGAAQLESATEDLYLRLVETTDGFRCYAAYLDVDAVLLDEGWGAIPLGF